MAFDFERVVPLGQDSATPTYTGDLLVTVEGGGVVVTARFPEQGSVTMPLDDDEVGALIDALQAARDATTKPLNGS